MDRSIAFSRTNYPKSSIKISAQQYLIKFYESHGFETDGEGYLEDGDSSYWNESYRKLNFHFLKS